MKIIIHPNKNNSISVTTPTGELSVEEVAKKDVPFGVPYFIIEDSELPNDQTFFDAWECDFRNPHGIGLGHNRYWVEKIDQEIEFLESQRNESTAIEIDKIIFDRLIQRKFHTDEIADEHD